MTTKHTRIPRKPFAYTLLASAMLSSLCATTAYAESWFSLGSTSYNIQKPYLDGRNIDPEPVPALPGLPPRESPPPYEPPPRPINNHVSRIALEDPGKVLVVEGSACGKSENPDGRTPITMHQSLEIPEYYTNPEATVFLNGWRFRYLGEDHHIGEVNARITGVEHTGNTLKWRAEGAFGDRNFDDGYEFCYQYTAIAWDQTEIHAIAADPSYINEYYGPQNYFFGMRNDDDGGFTTALGSFSAFMPNPWSEPLRITAGQTVPPSRGSVAILPRGFKFGWEGKPDALDPDTGFWDYADIGDQIDFWTNWGSNENDHQLLQVAYNKGGSTPFLEQGVGYKTFRNPLPPLSAGERTADPAYVSWKSQVIFKDNEGRRNHFFGEQVTALGGKDVQVIEPPFSILPREDDGLWGSCFGGLEETTTQEIVVKDLPFDYAVPMLTGWDLAYTCSDEEVLKMGIWVSNIRYEKDVMTGTGTLRYKVSSRLRDDDLMPGHIGRHKVSILGLNAGGPYLPSLVYPGDDNRFKVDANAGLDDPEQTPQSPPYGGLSSGVMSTPGSGWSLDAYR